MWGTPNDFKSPPFSFWQYQDLESAYSLNPLPDGVISGDGDVDGDVMVMVMVMVVN